MKRYLHIIINFVIWFRSIQSERNVCHFTLYILRIADRNWLLQPVLRLHDLKKHLAHGWNRRNTIRRLNVKQRPEIRCFVSVIPQERGREGEGESESTMKKGKEMAEGMLCWRRANRIKAASKAGWIYNYISPYYRVEIIGFRRGRERRGN